MFFDHNGKACMSFDWKTYLDLASELITQQKSSGKHEAYYRTAISRSYYGYYGVFGLANCFLSKKGVTIPLIDTHRFVIDTYHKLSRREEKQIGAQLNRLWLERKEADYKDSISIDRNRTETAFKLAQKTLSLLNAI